MKNRLLLLLLVLVAACDVSVAAAQHPPASSDALRLARWLESLQYTRASLPSFGALRVHHTSAVVGTDGQQYYRVSPYISNLAVLGLLRSRRPEALGAAERWIHWFFAHLNAESAPDGVPFEHFYLADGAGETICVKPGDLRLCRYNDATDSAAATFFLVLWEYKEAGGRIDVLVSRPHIGTYKHAEEGRSEKIEQLAGTLLALQNPDGLFWAKRDYRAKYLEDNCEVYAGLNALARLERTVYKNSGRAAKYAEASERLRNGILGELVDATHGTYFIAKFEDGTRKAADLNIWYPDLQAQFWPQLFGVVAASDAKSSAALAHLNSLWNGKERPDWAAQPNKVNGGWISADIAYAALLAGEVRRIPIYVAAVEHAKLAPRDPFGWPFTAADAGWLVSIVSNKAPARMK